MSDINSSISCITIEDGIGKGVIKKYKVREGITLFFHDIHMQSYVFRKFCKEKSLLITHCKEARAELSFTRDEVHIMGVGDTLFEVVDKNTIVEANFSLGRFHGTSVMIELEEIDFRLYDLLRLLGEESIDLGKLVYHLESMQNHFVLKGDPMIGSILNPLYNLPLEYQQKLGYLKFIELLIYAYDFIQIQLVEEEEKYFPKSQIELMKQIHAKMIGNLSEKYTIESLAEEYQIAKTSLKACFKYVYGMPIDTYMREYRMHAACELLRNTKLSILEIAQSLGYESASRFSCAFKKVIYQTPMSYRKG